MQGGRAAAMHAIIHSRMASAALRSAAQLSLTRVACEQQAHGVRAIQGLPHKEGGGAGLLHGVAVAQHLCKGGRWPGGKARVRRGEQEAEGPGAWQAACKLLAAELWGHNSETAFRVGRPLARRR